MKEQKITPFLWFDAQANEAATFYTSVFPNSNIESTNPLVTVFQLNNLECNALNGGPIFKFTNAISLFIKSNNSDEIDAIWNNLKQNGTILMDLDEYPWSKKYGWVNDKYGLSWQLFLDGDPLQIVPTLLFVDEKFGQAEEAITFYSSLFSDSEIHFISKFDGGNPNAAGKVEFAEFTMANQKFIAMESPMEHHFDFNEAFSFVINCKDQEEVDYYWNAFLQNGGQESQCGWLKDKFGISWQIIPEILPQLMNDKNPEKVAQVTQAMMQMKKIDCEKLQEAYNNK
ncbi:VOC family protein [Flavobacterium sp. J27]|uniref:VOC family protein n=1 Tax=Flavobacterium sp. J27 TaxID=2060419 RepID=UPI00102F35AC|nr:VOC family protein [Flavobacterium sp. J27]